MELEELREQWGQVERKLDRLLAIEEDRMRELALRPARRRVRVLAVGPAINLAFCAGLLATGVAMLSSGPVAPPRILPISLLMGCVLALMSSAIRQLAQVAGIDWSGPVADVQAGLARLRSAELRQFQWILLLSPLVWSCVLLVGFDWLEGRLPQVHARVLDTLAPWIVANCLFGALFVPIGYAVSRILAGRLQGRRWWNRLLDAIAGTSLAAAAREVDRWASLRQPGGEADR